MLSMLTIFLCLNVILTTAFHFPSVRVAFPSLKIKMNSNLFSDTNQNTDTSKSQTNKKLIPEEILPIDLLVSNNNITGSLSSDGIPFSFPKSKTGLPPSDGLQVPLKNNIIKKKVIKWYSPHGEDNELSRELVAGFVAALVTIPTSIAYATIIGLSPLVGVWSSFFVGLGVAIIGGGPGLIAGVSGVLAAPIAALVSTHGPAAMGPTVALAAAVELAFGAAKLGHLADHVTEPVIAGFLNAFSLFVIQKQLGVFRTAGSWLPPAALKAALGVATVCIGTIYSAPKLVTSIPPSLLGLVLSSVMSFMLALPVTTLASKFGKQTFAGGIAALPEFVGLPKIPTTRGMWLGVISTAIVISLISILETLLANRIACDNYRCSVETYEPDDPNRTTIGLGLGTAVSGLFNGFGGCGLIVNTMLNGKSGGEGYASVYAYAIGLAMCVVVFAPIIGNIPMAALAGLMTSIAINTFEWKTTRHVLQDGMKRVSSLQARLDMVALLVTMALCYQVDMGLGLAVGVIITKLSYIPVLVKKSVTQLKQKLKF